MNTPHGARHGSAPTAHVLSGVALLAVVVLGARGSPPPPAPTPPPPAPIEDSPLPEERDRLTIERQALNEYLYRDREFRVLLSRAEESARAGDAPAALELLQTLLDAPEDAFLWPQRLTAPPVPVSRAASDIMQRLPHEMRDAYERAQGPDAQRLLHELEHTDAPAAFRTLVRRFRHTAAGREAIARRAVHAMDRGHPLDAARLWRTLLDDPWHRGRLSALQWIQAATACHMAGLPLRDDVFPPGVFGEWVTLGGETRRAGEWVDELARRAAARPRSDDEPVREWAVASGNAARHRTTAGSPPVPEPVWSASCLEPFRVLSADIAQVAHVDDATPSPDVRLHVQDWLSARQEGHAPVAAVVSAIVVDDVLLVRDYQELSARDIHTGDLLWRFGCASSVRSALQRSSAESDIGDRRNPATKGVDTFQTAFVENSVLGTLASDGRFVFLVDDVSAARPRAEATGPAVPADTLDPATLVNRLLAVELRPGHMAARESVQPTWSVGGPRDESGAAALAGHYFLGPPLPVGDRLFVIAEHRRELHLLALDAGTGKLQWRQVIALVDLPIERDPRRARLACSPSCSEGVVVCPTQLGTLVGVDAATGLLLWVYFYADDEVRRQPAKWNHASSRQFGFPAFADLPLIHENRIISLPAQSQRVHCLSLLTGESVWTSDVPRHDALYAAAVHGDTLLLVGLRQCTGLRLCDGGIIWKQPIEPPAGRGVLLGGQFLLPLSDGRIVSLDPRTGQIERDLLARAPRVMRSARRISPETELVAYAPDVEFPPLLPAGNLAVYGDYVVSTSATGVVAYPQADAALQRVRRGMAEHGATPAALLRAGELALRLGDVAAARADLLAAWQTPSAPVVREAAARPLREVLYAELESGDPPAADTLPLLEALAGTPAERGRFLVRRLKTEVAGGHVQAAFATAAAIQELDLSQPAPMNVTGSHEVRPDQWIGVCLSRLEPRTLDAVHDPGPTFADGEPAPRPVRPTGSIEDLRRLLTFVAGTSTAGAVQNRLAAALIQQHDWQQAELLLLGTRCVAHDAAAAEATRILFELWDERGLHREAAQLLAEIQDRWASAHVAEGICGAADVDQMPRTGATWDAWRRQSAPPVPPTGRFEIQAHVCPPGCGQAGCSCAALAKLFDGGRELTRSADTTLRPADATLRLFDRTAEAGQQQRGLFSIVDGAQARLVGEPLEIPAGPWQPPIAGPARVGHLVPLAGTDQIVGLSLLEARVLWTLNGPFGGPNDRLRVGPCGPAFCAYQAGRELGVVDPATGALLWRRTDLNFESGLAANESVGLFGDEQVLVVCDSDQVACTLYDTRTGEQLRRGALDISPADVRRYRRACGRKLIYLNGAETPVLRIWDPLTDSIDLEERVAGRPLPDQTADDEIALILPGGRLKIVHVPSGEVRADVPLGGDLLEGVSSLRVFPEDDAWYVHLARNLTAPRVRAASNEVKLPATSLCGDLLAVERRTGTLLWTAPRQLPPCTLLHLPQYGLPFLLVMSRLGDSPQRQPGALTLDLIDRRTGATLNSRDDLPRIPIYHATCDVDAGQLHLLGLGARIQISFGTATATSR